MGHAAGGRGGHPGPGPLHLRPEGGGGARDHPRQQLRQHHRVLPLPAHLLQRFPQHSQDHRTLRRPPLHLAAWRTENIEAKKRRPP